MKKTVCWLGMLAIGAALQTSLAGFALAQGPAPAPAPTSPGPPPEGAEGGSNIGLPVVTSPTEAEPGTELPVLYVTSVEVMRTQTQPQLDIVRVTGLAGSQGWSSPELVPTYIGKPLDGILDLQLIATMPLQTEPATGFVPISAVFPLEEGHAFRGVRVRGSENAIEVDQIPGVQGTRITVNDCRDCVGKNLPSAGRPHPERRVSCGRRIFPKSCAGFPPITGSVALRTIPTG